MFAVRHTSRTIIDKHYRKWISEDAAFMAQMASDRLKMTRTRPRNKGGPQVFKICSFLVERESVEFRA